MKKGISVRVEINPVLGFITIFANMAVKSWDFLFTPSTINDLWERGWE